MRNPSITAGALAALLFLADSAPGQAPARLPPVNGLDEFMAVPEDNPLRVEVIRLGRRLFFDRRLSRDGTRSCASCHNPVRAFSDSVPVSSGVAGRRGRRNAPAIINRGYGTSFFWDGRATSLEQQVLGPLRNPNEFGAALPDVLARLRTDSSYRTQFAGAFGDAPTASALARAIASYVRSIRSGDSRADRYFAGDSIALTAQERRGLALFNGPARCSRCHVGVNFSDEDFHNTGVAVGTSDRGREAVTGRPEDRGKFKTPTLRDVAATAPYMHDGSLATLEAVIAFYDSGGRTNVNLDQDLRPLRLSPGARHDLAAFLRALTAPVITCGPIPCVP